MPLSWNSLSGSRIIEKSDKDEGPQMSKVRKYNSALLYDLSIVVLSGGEAVVDCHSSRYMFDLLIRHK